MKELYMESPSNRVDRAPDGCLSPFETFSARNGLHLVESLLKENHGNTKHLRLLFVVIFHLCFNKYRLPEVH